MKLKHLIAPLALGLAIAPMSFAGYVQPADVMIDLENNYAQGDLVTARTAKSDDVYIGCGTRVYEDGVGGIFRTGFCQAGDADGNIARCFTTNAGLLDEISTVADTGYIAFGFDENLGSCLYVFNSNQSFYLGKEVKEVK